MSKFNTALGYFTASSILITAVFKFEHFPGAESALIFTGLLLAIYFPLYILERMAEKSNGKIIPIHILAALCAFFTELGITFRIHHWSGSAVLLVLGLGGFALLFIPLHIFQRLKNKTESQAMVLSGGIGIASFALGTLFKLLHFLGAAFLLVMAPVFLCLLYFPLYLRQKNVSPEIKNKFLRESFITIVCGTLIALYFIKSIEIHDAMP